MTKEDLSEFEYGVLASIVRNRGADGRAPIDDVRHDLGNKLGMVMCEQNDIIIGLKNKGMIILYRYRSDDSKFFALTDEGEKTYKAMAPCNQIDRQLGSNNSILFEDRNNPDNQLPESIFEEIDDCVAIS